MCERERGTGYRNAYHVVNKGILGLLPNKHFPEYMHYIYCSIPRIVSLNLYIDFALFSKYNLF